MSEFNADLYKVKGVFMQDETEPIITGFYYQDEHKRHFIISDEDFKHYETNVYTLCRSTGIELRNSSYIPFENDVMQYKRPLSDRAKFGYIQFNQLRKSWVLITNSETNQYIPLDKCCDLLYTGRNVLVSDEDMKWFVKYSKREYEKSKSSVIDNSYCPSRFKK